MDLDFLKYQLIEYAQLIGIDKSCSATLLSLQYEKNCFELALSKGLGVGIILGASIVKVPQILKIVASKSTKGISFLSYFLETVSFLIFLSYNYRSEYPFSTYGEGLFVVFQNAIIMALMFSYKRRIFSGFFVFALLSAFGYALLIPEYVSADLLSKLQTSTIFLGIASKLPQILSNYSAKSTGSLSAITVLMQFAGTIARVFTTVKEVDDQLMVISSIVAAALNGFLVVQVGYYGSGSPAPSKVEKKSIKKKAQ